MLWLMGIVIEEYENLFLIPRVKTAILIMSAYNKSGLN
jgi:hypothetical protein